MLQNPPRETCSHSMPWQTLKKSLQNGQVLCPNIWNFGCQGISSKVSDSLLSSCCTHVSFVQHLFQNGRHLFWLSFSWVGPFFERESSSHESLSFFIIQYHLAMYCNNNTLNYPASMFHLSSCFTKQSSANHSPASSLQHEHDHF